MVKIPATEFKAKCLELMDRVAERRATYVITKHGKPVAKLVPVERKADEPLFGRLRGIAEEAGDIVGPVMAPDVWRTLGEWDELDASQTGTKQGAQKPRKTGRNRR